MQTQESPTCRNLARLLVQPDVNVITFPVALIRQVNVNFQIANLNLRSEGNSTSGM
jgi:hypothetical protein